MYIFDHVQFWLCEARHKRPFCVLIFFGTRLRSAILPITQNEILRLTESILHFAWLQRIFGILIKHIIWHFYYQNLDKGILVGTQCSSNARHQLLKILKIFSVMRRNEKGVFHTAEGMGLKPTKINAIFCIFFTPDAKHLTASMSLINLQPSSKIVKFMVSRCVVLVKELTL